MTEKGRKKTKTPDQPAPVSHGGRGPLAFLRGLYRFLFRNELYDKRKK